MVYCSQQCCRYRRGIFFVNIVVRYSSLTVAEDKKLPSVRPIRVTVPENYPENSPTCSTLPDQSGRLNVYSLMLSNCYAVSIALTAVLPDVCRESV